MVRVLSNGVTVSSMTWNSKSLSVTIKSISSEPIFASIKSLGKVMINSPIVLGFIEIIRDVVSGSISKPKTSPRRIV